MAISACLFSVLAKMKLFFVTVALLEIFSTVNCKLMIMIMIMIKIQGKRNACGKPDQYI